MKIADTRDGAVGSHDPVSRVTLLAIPASRERPVLSHQTNEAAGAPATYNQPRSMLVKTISGTSSTTAANTIASAGPAFWARKFVLGAP